MRIPLSWLGEYVDLDRDPAALADLLTAAGLEVTAVEHLGIEGADLVWDPELVRWAHVLRVEQHPDADRLVLATVDYGADEPKTVVTGAPNLFPSIGRDDLAAEGLFSPLLLEGGTYLDPYKEGRPTRLKGKSLRGIYNDAMLCSPIELGLGEEHDGILLVDATETGQQHPPGTPLQRVLGDAVLEIDIIPNIARCASIMGVAREVAALTRTELRPPSYEVLCEGAPLGDRVRIKTENPELNPRFVALLIEGVEQRPAPFWMQHRLRLAGQRPIHVVVDVSNYVMLEMGQPNHTFDYDFLVERAGRYDDSGRIEITTRLAGPGETLTTLDGAEHELRANNILVTDPEGILSLGGIMGGRDSEIQDGTKNVLLEAAAWNFINIRHSARQLGLQTEASFRFSRGVHPSQAQLGARRTAELLRRHAGGTVASGEIDYHPAPVERTSVTLEPSYVRRLSGIDLGAEEIADLLGRLGFETTVDGGSLGVVAPEHRIDIEGPHDLVEEVCRMYGYDRMPSTVLADALPTHSDDRPLEREHRLEDLLVEKGLYQAITYRLTTPEAERHATVEDDVAAEPPYIRLSNPATSERVVMRRHLLPSLLEIAAANSRYQDRIALFEIGQVYRPRPDTTLPDEPTHLALLLTGLRQPNHWQAGESTRIDFFDLKGIVEAIGDAFRIELGFRAAEHESFRPGRTAALSAGASKVAVGHLGELHPLVVERSDLRVADDQPVLAAELDLDTLLALAPERRQIEPVPVYPAVREDLAIVVDESLPASEIADTIAKAGGALVTHVEPFDVYVGDNLDAGKKSVAYHLTFQSHDKTLKDKQVAKLRRKIVAELERHLGASLRE